MFKQQLHEKKNNLTLRMMTFLVESTQTLKMIPVLDGIAQIIKNADEENQSLSTIFWQAKTKLLHS